MSTSAPRMPTLAPLRLPRLGDDRLAALAAAGDERAFEALYDRHHRALLGFCRHMLGTREEAEDALQQTFLRAHGALAARGAPAELRPWLFTIARNCCLTMLSARRPVADGERELASTEGLGEQVQVRADLRAVVADVERLPDEQRAALVLAELADLSHDQIAEVIGVRAGKVKALIHQARTTLIAEREARDTPCAAIREQLSTARGGALRRGPLRRHLRLCDGCRAYREAVERAAPCAGARAPGDAEPRAQGGHPRRGLRHGGAAARARRHRSWRRGGRGRAASPSAAASRRRSWPAAIVVGGTTAGGIAVVDHSAPRTGARAGRGARARRRAQAAARGRTPAERASSRAALAPVGAPRRQLAGRDKRRARRARARRRQGAPPRPASGPAAAAKARPRGARVPPGQAKKQAAPPAAKPVKVKKVRRPGSASHARRPRCPRPRRRSRRASSRSPRADQANRRAKSRRGMPIAATATAKKNAKPARRQRPARRREAGEGSQAGEGEARPGPSPSPRRSREPPTSREARQGAEKPDKPANPLPTARQLHRPRA